MDADNEYEIIMNDSLHFSNSVVISVYPSYTDDSGGEAEVVGLSVESNVVWKLQKL